MRPEELKTLWPEIEPLLDRLLELEEPERGELLERMLAGSPDTRRAVESLLRADRDAGEFLVHPPELPELPIVDEPGASATAPGRRIGPYVVRHEIARGGMGAVVLADRDDGQFSQQVAIKLVRSDAWAPEARERFVLERQILARLEHPHIARLLDGGMLEDGSPFLVMEYVQGLPITTWCDAHRLDLKARLQIFRQVCDAVEYAHSRLVIHRDLKPDNILVTERGDVKLLDFGIAKLLEPTGDASLTGVWPLAFTPAYVAPEQYVGHAVTVATDEYQLALVLHEMLTGQRVHGETTGSPVNRQRIVCETDPERPSTVVKRGAPARAAPPSAAPGGPDREVAALARGTSTPALVQALSGDLDAILLKALEREPERRYPSVEAFRRDLENVLENRPVTARRATTAYRARKYAKRHRFALIAGGLVMLSLVAGLVGVWIQARIAARERDLARESERKATAINDFILRELLESSTPERTLGRPLAVSEVLANASRTIEHAFPGQPTTEAGVRMTLARSYQALGQLDQARIHAEIAQRLLERHLPPESRERMEARELLGDLAIDQGRFAEAQATFEQLAALEETILGPADPATLRVWGELARTQALQGRYAPAEARLRRALAALPPPGDTPWRLAVELRGWLASVLLAQSQASAAESLFRQSLAIERRHLGPDHPVIISTMRGLAMALDKDLRFPQAEQVLTDVVAMSLRINGEYHPATGDAYMTLASNLDAQLRPVASLQAVERAVDIYHHALGADHPKTLHALRNQAVLLRGERRFGEADSVYLEVYQACVRTLGPEHPQTIEALKGIHFLREQEGRAADAREVVAQLIATYEQIAAHPDADPTMLSDYALFLVEVDPANLRQPRRAIEIAQRAVEATQHRDYLALRTLGFAQAEAGQPRAAIASLRAALALPEGTRSWTTEDKLVALLEHYGQPGELERVLLERLDQERTIRGPDDRYIAKTLRHLSRYEARLGRHAEAERYARATLEQLLKTLPPGHWEVGRAKSELGEMLLADRGYGEAESLLVQGFGALEGDPETPSQNLEAVRRHIVELYTVQHRTEPADAWRKRVIPIRQNFAD